MSVEAGATWSDVLAATLPAGLTPPVLPDYLELSVGGTLAVGGVGGTTSMFGMVSDTVAELDVVTGRGEMLTCSPARNADLFDMVRAGLGQVGVITRATLRCVAAPREVRQFLLSYPTLAAMLHDARLLAGDDRFDVVKGAILPAAGRWVDLPAGRRQGLHWSSHPTTASCWPACPTTPRCGSRRPWPTSTTSGGSPRWRRRCGPTGGGRSRTRGSPCSSATPPSSPW